MSNNESSLPSASVISKEAGLVIFGSAVGVLIAGAVGSHARKPLSLILGAAGVLAAGPEISKLINKAVNSPSTARGSKKTLEGIRYGVGAPMKKVDGQEGSNGENLFIG